MLDKTNQKGRLENLKNKLEMVSKKMFEKPFKMKIHPPDKYDHGYHLIINDVCEIWIVPDTSIRPSGICGQADYRDLKKNEYEVTRTDNGDMQDIGILKENRLIEKVCKLLILEKLNNVLVSLKLRNPETKSLAPTGRSLL